MNFANDFGGGTNLQNKLVAERILRKIWPWGGVLRRIRGGFVSKFDILKHVCSPGIWKAGFFSNLSPHSIHFAPGTQKIPLD